MTGAQDQKNPKEPIEPLVLWDKPNPVKLIFALSGSDADRNPRVGKDRSEVSEHDEPGKAAYAAGIGLNKRLFEVADMSYKKPPNQQIQRRNTDKTTAREKQWRDPEAGGEEISQGSDLPFRIRSRDEVCADPV